MVERWGNESWEVEDEVAMAHYDHYKREPGRLTMMMMMVAGEIWAVLYDFLTYRRSLLLGLRLGLEKGFLPRGSIRLLRGRQGRGLD